MPKDWYHPLFARALIGLMVAVALIYSGLLLYHIMWR